MPDPMKGIAFLFPGNLSAGRGMLDGLTPGDEHLLQPLREASGRAGRDLVELCRQGADDEIRQDPLASLAVVAVDVAAFRMLEGWGIAPVALAGYGPGYLAAVVAAGVLPLSLALEVAAREQQIGWEVLGGREFDAVELDGFSPDQVEEVLGDLLRSEALSLAAQDGERRCTVAGERDATRSALDRLAGREVRVEVLPRCLPRNTSAMLPVPARLNADFGKIAVEDPGTPLYSHFDGSLVLRGWQAKELMIKQMIYPLRWDQCVRGLVDNGVDTFVEVGPGCRLTELVREIAPDARIFDTSSPASVARLRTSVSSWSY